MVGKKILLGAILLLFSSVFVFGQIENMNEAINKAGRQRMLSQRIAKDYMLLGMNVSPTEVKQEQLQSIKLFEEQLEELIEFSPTEEITVEFEKIKFSWGFYKKILLKRKVNRENAVKIVEYSNKILKEADGAVKMLEKYAGKNSAKIINISGKQRMLSQRIALYYLAYKWGVPNENIVPRFESAKEEFWAALKYLMKSPHNSGGIDLYLRIVKSQFRFERRGYDLNGNLSAIEIFIFTNEITGKMNTITGLYQEILK